MSDEMPFNELNAESMALLKEYGSKSPETMKHFQAFHSAAIKPGALNAKTKELIALTMGIAEGCPRCIGLHIEAAVKNGATDQEIAETIDVCVLMGGGPALMHGLEALKALKSLREESRGR